MYSFYHDVLFANIFYFLISILSVREFNKQVQIYLISS